MQSSRKPSNIGGLMAILGLAVLVAGFVIMLLLPEIRISAWGILGVGIVLLGSAFVIDFRQVRRAITGRRGRFGLGTGVMASIFIGIMLLVNAISIVNYHRFDTSSLAQFTLTPQTINVLTNLKTPVKALGFFVPNDALGIGSYVSSLLNEYKIHARQLTIQYIDPDEHPDQAKKYGITEYQTVVFKSGEHQLLVPPSQFVSIDEAGDLTMKAEHAFTSAILQVTGISQKKVYFLTGHGEASTDLNFSRAKEGLRNDLYLVDTLNLITDPSIPDDCAVLIVAAPQNPLSSNEVAIIDDYLKRGGQALILTNPDSPPDIKQLVSPWGVDIMDGTIVDPASSVSPHQDMPLVPANRNYFLLPGVYFPGATAITPQEPTPPNVKMMPLVYTSTSSWLDKNFTSDEEPVFNPETEKMGSLAIGVLIVGAPTVETATNKLTRLVVIGDADFASNEHFYSANNGDLFLNAVNWLAEETSLISIHRNVQPFRRLVVTPGQSRFIEYSSMALFPLLLLLAAGVIWWRRR